MESTPFDCLRSSMDQLATTQQLLLACMDTPEQAVWTQPNHPAGIEDGAIDVGTVEPLTYTQLDEIKRDVNEFKSTWESLREQYPPGKSDFAPLSFTASSWTAIASTGINGLDDDLETDETYSQSTTMTAYGVNLLRKALAGPQVDRRMTQQVYNLLATLCAMLTDSQDRHKSKVTRAVGEKVEAFKRARTMDEDTHTVSAGIHKRAKRSEHTPDREQPVHTPKASRRDSGMYLPSPTSITRGRQVGGSDTSQHSHSYHRDHSPSAEPLLLSLPHTLTAEPSSPVTAQNVHLARHAPLFAQSLGTVDNPPTPDTLRTGLITSASTASMTEFPTIRALKRGVPIKLHRQNIIRESLLRQGWTTPAINAYFHRLTKGTNHSYNSLWNSWVYWCIDRNLDPKKSSSADLDDFVSELTKSESQKWQIASVVKAVWSIADGTAKLSDL